jgi:hypothetical protein
MAYSVVTTKDNGDAEDQYDRHPTLRAAIACAKEFRDRGQRNSIRIFRYDMNGNSDYWEQVATI